jgi:hypothetical protein
MKKHKAAAYEYWIVECLEDSRHLIPIRRAVSTNGRRLSPAWPIRFQAKCPLDGKTSVYGKAEIRVEGKIAFPLIPVSQLPRFSR